MPGKNHLQNDLYHVSFGTLDTAHSLLWAGNLNGCFIRNSIVRAYNYSGLQLFFLKNVLFERLLQINFRNFERSFTVSCIALCLNMGHV